MKPTVYLDVILLINLVMNFILLYLSAKLAGKKPRIFRILLGSVLASVYAVLVFLPQLAVFYTFFFKVVFSLVFLWVSISVKSIRDLLKLAVIFYITSFAFGGCVLAFFWMLGRAGIHVAAAGSVSVVLNFPYLLFSLAVGACIALYFLFDRWMKNKKMVQSHVMPVRVEYRGRSLVVDTLLDTGCTLKDPVSQKPVFVVEANLLSAIYPKDVLRLAQEFYESGALNEAEKFAAYQMRLVPYTALPGGDGMLVCVPADLAVFLDRPERAYDCLIGIYGQAFKSEYYRALVGPDAVFGEQTEGIVCEN